MTYEEMIDVMTDSFSMTVIKYAMEKKNAYQPIPDDAVSSFWGNLYEYAKRRYPNLYDLMPTKTDKARGARAQWPGFRTNVAGTEIQWKADRGAVDLQLNSMVGCEQQIEDMLNRRMIDCPYKVLRTGKSVSLRKEVPRIDFRNCFSEQREDVDIALNAVVEMYNLAQEISGEIRNIREDLPQIKGF